MTGPDRMAAASERSVLAGLAPPLLVAACLASGATTVMAVAFAGESRGCAADAWLYAWLNHSVERSSLGYGTAWLVGGAADPPVAGVLVVALAIICLTLGRGRLAVLAVAGPVITGVVTTVMKPVVGRTIHGNFLSFPSGHTAVVTCFGLILGLLLAHRVRSSVPVRTCFVLAFGLLPGLAMSWSQTANSVHYWTDTIGGACIALVVVPVTGWIIDTVASRSR